MRIYKVHSRETLLEQRNKNSLTHLLKDKKLTLKQKRTLIKERNPFLHVFGDSLLPQGWQDYETYLNKLYIGEVEAQQTRSKGEPK